MTEERPILLVDDDPDIREALAEVLEQKGFEVVTAGNGQEALSLLRSMRVAPAVILLDLMMPIMDGYGFLAAQRNEPALEDIPVVVITASHHVDRARLADSSAVIAKPIKVPQLMSVIRRLGSIDGTPPA